MHVYNDCSLPPGQGSVYKADMRINEKKKKKKVKSMGIFLSNQKSEFKCGPAEGFICLKYLSIITSIFMRRFYWLNMLKVH